LPKSLDYDIECKSVQLEEQSPLQSKTNQHLLEDITRHRLSILLQMEIWLDISIIAVPSTYEFPCIGRYACSCTELDLRETRVGVVELDGDTLAHGIECASSWLE